MTGPELKAALAAIGWKRVELARRLNRVPQQIDAMVWGKRPVQEPIARYVRDAKAALDAVPIPSRDEA